MTLYDPPMLCWLNIECALLRLYHERLQQIDAKLEEVKGGQAIEYLSPLAQLEENMRVYTEVAGRKGARILPTCKMFLSRAIQRLRGSVVMQYCKKLCSS